MLEKFRHYAAISSEQQESRGLIPLQRRLLSRRRVGRQVHLRHRRRRIQWPRLFRRCLVGTAQRQK